MSQADNAIGIGGFASGFSAISVGYQSKATGIENVAIGRTAVANGISSMAIGSHTKTFDAAGNSTDKAELDRLRSNYTIAGHNIEYVGTSNTASAQVAVGTRSQAGGWGATAMGYQAYALNSQASALGDYAKALGYASSAVGTHSYASGRHATALGNGSEALGNHSAAIGAGAAATADKSIALGWGAGASGTNAIAIGASTGAVHTWSTHGEATSTTETQLDHWAASGDNSIALGTDTQASASGSMALGRNATAASIGGVAIGAESVADRAALTGAVTSSSASAAANQVYAMKTAAGTDKAAILATVQGNQGAISVGTVGQTRQITNVAAGSNDSDAVNVSQLKAVANGVSANTENISNINNQITNINSHISGLDSRINKVGAGAAALASLHPLDFDPDDKWDFAAGVGNYRNETAAAVGLFYRPNERSMFNLGWTMGDNRNMVNGGFSVKLGKGSVYDNMSKARMAETIEAQNREISAIKADYAALKSDNEAKGREIEILKKQMREVLRKLNG